ncbi:MAG: hypothetical protein KKE76_06800, partial [Gammaproteobacteria bacterium]|nr:hypothetical protein [Gammaproteobacteria bacterium]
LSLALPHQGGGDFLFYICWRFSFVRLMRLRGQSFSSPDPTMTEQMQNREFPLPRAGEGQGEGLLDRTSPSPWPSPIKGEGIFFFIFVGDFPLCALSAFVVKAFHHLIRP